jgi:tetratricopeptide (TPR) repeat protein
LWREGKRAAAKAQELDPSLAAAHLAQAMVQSGYERDFAAAEASFGRAMELGPGDPQALGAYGEMCLAPLGRFEDAIRATREAESLDPLNPAIVAGHGRMLHLAERIEEAVAQYKKAIGQDAGLTEAYAHLALAYAQKGRCEEFRELLPKMPSDQPHAVWGMTRCGDREQALKGLQAYMKSLARSNFGLAEIHAGLGDADSSFRHLEAAIAEKEPATLVLRYWPFLEPLRTDRRWLPAVAKTGPP